MTTMVDVQDMPNYPVVTIYTVCSEHFEELLTAGGKLVNKWEHRGYTYGDFEFPKELVQGQCAMDFDITTLDNFCISNLHILCNGRYAAKVEVLENKQ